MVRGPLTLPAPHPAPGQASPSASSYSFLCSPPEGPQDVSSSQATFGLVGVAGVGRCPLGAVPLISFLHCTACLSPLLQDGGAPPSPRR
jgi:hypothetical protein